MRGRSNITNRKSTVKHQYVLFAATPHYTTVGHPTVQILGHLGLTLHQLREVAPHIELAHSGDVVLLDLLLLVPEVFTKDFLIVDFFLHHISMRLLPRRVTIGLLPSNI